MYFQYGDRETRFLKSRDPSLGEAIDRIGHIHREVDSDLFPSVIRHIIGQQISTKAQATIWQRLIDKVGNVCVDGICSDAICALAIEEIQGLGMTFRKAEYIKDFALRVKNNEFDLDGLVGLPDGEVVKKLTALKGIGVWTAEMIMIFGLKRPDVVSYGDLGIRRGMGMLYRHETIDKKRFMQYRERYSPYGSVASLYLWAIAGGG